MAGYYRITRNIEASIIEYLTALLVAQWTDISVEKSYTRIYDISLPSVCIRVGTTTHEKAEIGADSTTRTPQVLIDIFATDDGMKLDIKDFIIEKIKGGCDYYEYEVTNGAFSNQTLNGRIRVIDIDDTPLNLNIDKERLDDHDRYRHLLTLSISLGRVET